MKTKTNGYIKALTIADGKMAIGETVTGSNKN